MPQAFGSRGARVALAKTGALETSRSGLKKKFGSQVDAEAFLLMSDMVLKGEMLLWSGLVSCDAVGPTALGT